MTPINPSNILRHELIGLDVKIVKDSNPDNVSISGKVVDESRGTLVIRENGRDKRVAKKNALFLFDLNHGSVEVEGSTIVGRPEDRVRRRIKRRW